MNAGVHITYLKDDLMLKFVSVFFVFMTPYISVRLYSLVIELVS